MLTYNLLKTQSKPLSTTSRKDQPDADLHTVQNQEHALVSNKQQEQSQMLSYILFKSNSMPFLATSREGQPHPDLHPVQNPEHAPVSNKQGSTCSLTTCSKPRECSCQ